jgi:hypothetical protein
MTKRALLVAAATAAITPKMAVAQQEDFFQGREVFTQIVEKARTENWNKLPIGEVVGKIGRSFVGTPYVGKTFEIFDDREVCVINLNGLDCATFYEASLALARTVKSKRQTPVEFQKQVQRIRYRGGKLDGYVSRLHYSTDYFFDNELKGILNVISDDFPGANLFEKKVSYMSSNPDQYRQLKANASLVPLIAKTENDINARRTFFIPKAKVADAETLLKTGDIIGLTTSIPGLDVSHTGICYRDENGILRFMHASSSKKQVILDERLSEYLAKSKINDGIVVARPLELN